MATRKKDSSKVTAPARTKVPKEYTTEQIARQSGRTLGYESKHWYHIFLDALRQVPSVTAACKKATVARRTAYWHRELYEEFAKDWDDALEEGRDLIEEDMIAAARNGDVKAQEYLLTKWRYGMNVSGKGKKTEEPQKITLAWGK